MLWIFFTGASQSESIAMTNKEILHADLLDILFENRNKAYGAYMLRKNYNHRLQWALGISLSLVLLLSIFDVSRGKGFKGSYDDNKKELKLISYVESPVEKKVDPPKPKVEPVRREIAYTSRIEIVPNNIKTEMPEMTDIGTSDISTKTVGGALSSDTVQTSRHGDVNETGAERKSDDKENILPSSDAQFPGGKEAFAKFLTKYLITPGELEAGEKRVVLVRFMVDADGTISKTEVVQSDGDDYSKEVIRVLAKMPKWIPAMQNGTKVATWFTQPVSFISVE